MTGKSLDPDQIKLLLAPKPKPKIPTGGGINQKPARTTDNPPQWGPLTFNDKETRCESSGYIAIDTETNERYYKKTQGRCGSPTNWGLNGVPYCLLHAAYKMSDQIYTLNGGVIDVREGT